MAAQPVEIFISYSHRDEDFKDELEAHLSILRRQKKIEFWHDRAIEAGSDWNADIKSHLESANIILLLVSPRFLASEYFFEKEIQRSLERHVEGLTTVIPIILKPCDWQGTPFSKLSALPKDGKPVTKWDDRDEAFLNVIQSLRKVIDQKIELQDGPKSSLQELAIVSEPSGSSVEFKNHANESKITRINLLQTLSSLPSPQFEQLVFTLSPPIGNIPSSYAPQGQRTSALLEWAESPIGPGLSHLQEALKQVTHS